MANRPGDESLDDLMTDDQTNESDINPVVADDQADTGKDKTATKDRTVEDHIDKFLADEQKTDDAEPQPKKPARPDPSAQQHQTRAKPGKFSYGKDGSVLDEMGQIVARPGAERRHWQAAQQASQRAERAEQVYRELEGKYRELEQGLAHGRAAGLTNEETLAALQAWGWYKKEPEAMLKWLLTSAQASGYNILDLAGIDAQSGVNLKAITKAIDDRLKPITDAQQAQRDYAERYAAADREMQQFNAMFPNAMMNEELIVQLMDAVPELTHREAWLRIENWALQNQLDVNKPLRPQAEAKLYGGNPAAQPPRRTAPSMPRGRGGSVETVEGPRGAFDESSFDSIIASSMREQGLDPRRMR